ncbi:MAG TPA: tRNA pseudouridine(55) synthase TruB [Dissulfurispiraceae bacterium]|nr:tRNA pseudouridine(55) synthase TruB [Dissulfurispiraceae bacterium]
MNVVANLNKEVGVTSQSAVTAVKKAFKVRRAGHTGTLDPMASGVMLVCLNEATKIASFVESLDKEYIATAKLGESTDTFDAEGRIVRTADAATVSTLDIERVLRGFIGDIEQLPPMYCALKVSGQPLYKLARKGIEVERKPRRIRVDAIELLDFSPPLFTIKVVCSKGTYIRSICNDIGDALGVGAHVIRLLRTKVGPFCIESAAKIAELPHKIEAVYSVDAVLSYLPELTIGGELLKRAMNGNPLPLSLLPDVLMMPGSPVRLKDERGRIVGIGKVAKDFIRIKRLLFL